MVDWSLRAWIVALVGLAAATSVSRAWSADVSPAANGRLEGTNPTAALQFAQSGRIAEILVAEGESIREGQPLAQLDCSNLKAQLRAATAALEIAKRGERAEAIAVQQAEVTAIEAEKGRYEAQVRRLERLAAKDLAAKGSLEDAELLVRQIEARRQVALLKLVEFRNPQPAQERAAVAAQVEALVAQIRECTLQAPTHGVVVRRLLEPGAVVSTLTPEPVFLFADTRIWHVRAEIDESDVGRVRVGHKAVVTAPAFGTSKANGTVIRVSPMMGRRTVLSGDPGEKMDRDVNEVLVRLASRPPVSIIGLRVKVRFEH
jgi:multidrug resistance efflux pump